jgi:serine/threonine-protein kinase RsbW
MNDGLTWLTLPARLDSLPQFNEFLHEAGRRASLPEAEFGKLELVWEEIFVNIASYAYPEGETGNAEVGYAVTEPGCLLVQVRDSGQAFNPLKRDPPDLRADLAGRTPGGLGIFLVQSLADSVGYAYVDGRNVLYLTFRG